MEFTRLESDGIASWTDVGLRDEYGILVAFSERGGGASTAPYEGLNLAAHVGDEPAHVDENRDRWLGTLGLECARGRLVTAQQIHGSRVVRVDEKAAGAGAFAGNADPPVPSTDGLVTALEDTPLMLLFADCVPVVLAATAPRRTVCVVHAGWRGVAAGIVRTGVEATAREAGSTPSDVRAYIGPHIGACHYEVGDEVLSRFAGVAATISPAPGRLDLQAAVVSDLDLIGVPMDQRASLGMCTAEETGRFYSYRVEALTGRHAALAAILEG